MADQQTCEWCGMQVEVREFGMCRATLAPDTPDEVTTYWCGRECLRHSYPHRDLPKAQDAVFQR
jgi:hypothetical protein